MPRASREQSLATAAEVLATARRLFVAEGYAGVGLEEVAAAAGVTRGAVYHHYASKRGLFEAVLGQVHAEVGDAVAGAATGSGWASLRRGCRAFLLASLAPDVRRLLLVEAPAVLGWELWRSQDAAASGRLLSEGLTELAAAGELAVTEVDAVAAVLSGAMNEAALWAAASDDPGGRAEEAWAVLERVLDALRA
jgi:AcrR family transcriptional regulator